MTNKPSLGSRSTSFLRCHCGRRVTGPGSSHIGSDINTVRPRIRLSPANLSDQPKLTHGTRNGARLKRVVGTATSTVTRKAILHATDALHSRRNVIRRAGSLNVAATDLDGGCVDQFQAWLGNDLAGPTRETWDEAAQDAVSASLAAWVTDCIAMAINWSTAPPFIARTRRTSDAHN